MGKLITIFLLVIAFVGCTDLVEPEPVCSEQPVAELVAIPSNCPGV